LDEPARFRRSLSTAHRSLSREAVEAARGGGFQKLDAPLKDFQITTLEPAVNNLLANGVPTLVWRIKIEGTGKPLA
jgi:hypothetical protein